jgi:hypothetical protein
MAMSSKMTQHSQRVFELLDGEVRLYEQQEAIHLRAVDSHGDPVELTASAARKLAEQLLALAEQIGG